MSFPLLVDLRKSARSKTLAQKHWGYGASTSNGGGIVARSTYCDYLRDQSVVRPL